ncbi:hypothetical protein P43SY_001140 [Pythium insidiosum]|uniref:Protein kinase domain-containing protein n=1 Tax=Pythium insidiosum TaxID=114742 RepID=A0AAD5QDU5_PYTIN|nr:hypothetical protein P43SY_001140 [Pythium insidiosum]
MKFLSLTPLLALLVASPAVLGASCNVARDTTASVAEETKTLTQLYDEAVKEGGRLVVYHGGDTPDQQDSVANAFREAFPKVNLTMIVDYSKYHNARIDNQLETNSLCFLSEAKLMAAMRHDRIITFVGVGWDDPMDVHVVTEYMDGGDLRALLQWLKAENRPTGFDLEKLKIALHIIEALAYLHNRKPQVLHRDLKSRNVLLSSALDAKLIDFGVSRERVDYTMTEGVGTLDTHLLPYERPGMDPLPNPAVITQVTINRLQVTFTEAESHPMVVLARDCMAFEANERPKTSLVLKRMRAIFAKANGEDSDAFDE